jgi:broad-specificity NMP kinase
MTLKELTAEVAELRELVTNKESLREAQDTAATERAAALGEARRARRVAAVADPSKIDGSDHELLKSLDNVEAVAVLRQRPELTTAVLNAKPFVREWIQAELAPLVDMVRVTAVDPVEVRGEYGRNGKVVSPHQMFDAIPTTLDESRWRDLVKSNTKLAAALAAGQITVVDLSPEECRAEIHRRAR